MARMICVKLMSIKVSFTIGKCEDFFVAVVKVRLTMILEVLKMQRFKKNQSRASRQFLAEYSFILHSSPSKK